MCLCVCTFACTCVVSTCGTHMFPCLAAGAWAPPGNRHTHVRPPRRLWQAPVPALQLHRRRSALSLAPSPASPNTAYVQSCTHPAAEPQSPGHPPPLIPQPWPTQAAPAPQHGPTCSRSDEPSCRGGLATAACAEASLSNSTYTEPRNALVPLSLRSFIRFTLRRGDIITYSHHTTRLNACM